MQYTSKYSSPLGEITLAADESGLFGLWFEGQKYFCDGLEEMHEEKQTPAIEAAKSWLDIYFSGKEPNFNVPLSLKGTPFQLEVWEELSKVPYGKTVTYGQIAKTLAKKKGRTSMSAQAVGAAVGKNKISIIIPCHRVIGANGSLTGYAGGIERKEKLLAIEK